MSARAMTPLETPQDAEQLRLLSLFHYVVAGMAALLACLPAIHLVVGLLILAAPGLMEEGGQPPPPLVGWLFTGLGASFILAGWTLAALLVFAGRSLAQRKRYLFCLVFALIEAATCMPFGTVLGVFTIVVLVRPSVKLAFGQPSASPPPADLGRP